MFGFRSGTRSRDRRGIFLALVCVLLIAVSGAVQVTHSHGLDSSSHPDCSLCVVAHAGIAPLAQAAVPVLIEHERAVEVFLVESPRNSFVFSFYSRPPPAEPASI
jgi:hypothetical protein